MIPETHFQSFIHQIVLVFFPSERTPFELSAHYLIGELYKGKNIRKTKSSESDLSFLDSTKEVLEFIALMVSTYKTIKDTMKKRRKRNKKQTISDKRKELSDAWKRNLVQNGISEEKAEMICEKFITDMNKIIEEKK